MAKPNPIAGILHMHSDAAPAVDTPFQHKPGTSPHNTSGGRKQSFNNKKRRYGETAEALQQTGAEARLAIAIVIFFVVAFILVIGMKLLQERRAALADSVLSQAYSTANLAEQVRTRLAGIENYASAVALSLESVKPGQRTTLARKLLAKLDSRPIVAGATILSARGQVEVNAAKGADFAPLMATMPSWRRKTSGPFYQIALGAGHARLYLLKAMHIGHEPAFLAIEFSGVSLLPLTMNDTDAIVLVGQSGNIIAANRTAVPAALLRTILSETATIRTGDAKRAMSGFQIRDEEGKRYVVGASALPGGVLTLLRIKPLLIDGAAWRRTLTFFVLMTIAPLLVAAVLCVVLLVQVDTLRVARRALADSEKRFRLALEYARGGVWDWNLDSNQVFVTDSLAQIFNWKKGATVPVSEFLVMVHADDRKALFEAMKAAPDAGDVDIEFRAANLPIWLHARGRPWGAEGAAATGRVVGVAIEITQQKEGQARVHAAENRLRAALESMSESFVVWDVKRRLVLSNRKFSDFFNIEPSLLCPGISYEKLEKAADPAIRSAREGADSGAIELELTDGRWVHLSERPTRDGGLVSIGTDITALKMQEQLLLGKEKDLRELARNYEQEKFRAIEANSAKNEFLANMSHELRTPLNAINGFSEIMQNEMFGPLGDSRYKEYVSDILSSGQHLLTLINDILDMSKIEAGKLNLQTETVFVDELIEQCMRIVRGRAKESGLKLVLDIGELPQIEADPRAIKQVVINLLSNGIKFTPKGGTVTLKANEDRGGIRCIVTDTGIGIPEDQLPLICKPFVQVENQHSKSHKGSGLGLALSQSLVHLHGGTFEISSEVGTGTTVSFWLPAVAAEDANADSNTD